MHFCIPLARTPSVPYMITHYSFALPCTVVLRNPLCLSVIKHHVETFPNVS